MNTVRLIVAMGYAAGVMAQPTNSPAFDVASVRLHSAVVNESSINRAGGRITMDNVSLRECVMYAYSIPPGREYQLKGPRWLEGEHFDVVATFPPTSSRDVVRQMMQTLLAERFDLRVHRESRSVKAYALVKAKRGPKLDQPGSGEDGAFTFREGRVAVRAMTMSSFADRLSGSAFHLDRPVVDKTGIIGAYDFTLEWTPIGVSASEKNEASLFTALEEQLGLKLEAQRISVSILVVDHVNRVPSGN